MKPQMLNEEQRHNMYSVEVAEKHYKKCIYPSQRGDWFHGRISGDYRDNYDRIFGKKRRNHDKESNSQKD